ncbi:MAG TPA: hypothetical protein EYP17_04095 [Candidatus Latescibacteria bacterium]|nr:hypothetical protein [Candidatus Latescibacterota bacterium]
MSPTNVFVCRALLVGLLCAPSLIPIERVHAEPFYENFLIQRMMIAKVREFRGDPMAESLLQTLSKEAIARGVRLPKWAGSGTRRAFYKHRVGAGRKADPRRYNAIIQKASETYNLPPALIKAVIHAESSFAEGAVSKRGAQGLMQLMPHTAKRIGVQDPFDPRANIFGGSRLLRRYLDEFGSLKKALIAYNAGPHWVRQRKGVPKETRIYIRRVINYYTRYKDGGKT